jgi:hypothetical protein
MAAAVQSSFSMSKFEILTMEGVYIPDSFYGRNEFSKQLLIELTATRAQVRLLHAAFSALNPLSAMNLVLFGLLYSFCYNYIMIPDSQGVINSRRCAFYAMVPTLFITMRLTHGLPVPWLPLLP